MDIYSTLKLKKRTKSSSPKIHDLSGNKTKISFFFFVSLVVLLIGMPFLGLPIQKSESEESKLSSSPLAMAQVAELLSEENVFVQEKLPLLNGNTLIPFSNPANPEPEAIKRLLVIVTGYSSAEDQTDSEPFITAAGTRVKDGIIANNYFSFGTKVKLPELFGDEVFVVEDRMHWRKSSYYFDIWFPSYSEALNFGAKRTYIEVLES